MIQMESLLQLINAAVDQDSGLLYAVNQEIWKKPELRFKEVFAHEYLSDVFEKKGFSVKRNHILPTAFIATFDSGRKGPTVAVLLEYDALPKIGHACGHNLIAEAGLGAALAIKAALQKNTEIAGKVIAMGTPAEEGGGGKIDLIKGGAFKGIDITLMVHPAPDDHLYAPFIGVHRMTVNFYGKEAHASGFPWEGINALDAAVSCYNSLSLLRQHIKPTCRINSIIKKGGDAANVIPGYSQMDIFIRAASVYDMENLKTRVGRCIESAAAATGCTVSSEYLEDDYEGLITNQVLAERYKVYAERLGVTFSDGNPKKIAFMASSDIGNVSRIMPTIHPTYSIGTRAPNHSEGFTQAAGTREAHLATLVCAKSMALVALEAMIDSSFLEEAKQRFRLDLVEDASS